MTPPTQPDGGPQPQRRPPTPGGSSGHDNRDRRDTWNSLDQSSVMTVELLGALFVWGGAGWLADRWLGTRPWLLGLGVAIGFAAGIYLVWLRGNQMDEADRRARERRAADDDRTKGT
jgi:ATP synthase protein I